MAGRDIGILPLCRALIGGGGLKNLQSIMVLDGTLVQANQAQYGSGIDISNAGNAGMPCPTIVLAQNSIFSLNSATEKGAGFSIFNIYLASFTNVTFDSNFGELWPDQGRTLCVARTSNVSQILGCVSSFAACGWGCITLLPDPSASLPRACSAQRRSDYPGR